MITVGGVLAEHVDLSILGDHGAAAAVAGCKHHLLALKADHLLGLHRLRLAASFG